MLAANTVRSAAAGTLKANHPPQEEEGSSSSLSWLLVAGLLAPWRRLICCCCACRRRPHASSSPRCPAAGPQLLQPPPRCSRIALPTRYRCRGQEDRPAAPPLLTASVRCSRSRIIATAVAAPRHAHSRWPTPRRPRWRRRLAVGLWSLLLRAWTRRTPWTPVECAFC